MTEKPLPLKSPDRLIKMGVISGAHGIRGEVKIRSFTADPRDITAYGPLQDSQGHIHKITITGGNDVLIARIEGIANRDEAEKLRNIELWVPRSALPKTDKHQYYHEDLAGISLITETGSAYGILSGISNFGAGDLAVIKKTSGEEEYLPFTKKIFPVIDIDAGKATVIPPEIETSNE